MVVYFHNAHVAALEEICRRWLQDSELESIDEHAAVMALHNAIVREKQLVPFQIWQRQAQAKP